VCETSGTSFGFLRAPTCGCVVCHSFVSYKLTKHGGQEHGEKKEMLLLFLTNDIPLCVTDTDSVRTPPNITTDLP
jgi:hypothetical protein